MEATVETLKQRARATWAAGDFDDVAQLIWSVGPELVERVGIEPGMRVLDVACGTGNATIPAAAAGGRTTGVDLTPELFEDGRRHAAEAGVEIDWVEGDAEDLPFDDGSFDRVLSTFGVMFAPRHEVAAAELARVCAPGGVIGVCSWTPTGFVGEMFKTMATRMPPLPDFAKPPLLWGDEGHVRALLEPHGIEVECEPTTVIQPSESVEAAVQRMETKFGPWIMAKNALGDEWPEVRAEMVDLFGRAARPSDNGGVEVEAEYLRVVGTKTG